MKKEKLYSIGDLSSILGISVHNLRIWERRYGAPYSIKRDSGHRRYPEEELNRLQLVKTALGAGFKPSKVVPLKFEELKKLLKDRTIESQNPMNTQINLIIQLIKGWKSEELESLFDKEWQALGPVGFVIHFVPSILDKVGEAWSLKEIMVAHEHFFSELLHAFLTQKWKSLDRNPQGPLTLLACLPDENHSFGLDLCAVILAHSGHRLIMLGSSTPLEDILAATKQSKSKTVCLSMSHFSNKEQNKKQLLWLRQNLPAKVQILVGGRGAPPNVEGTFAFNELKDFYSWLGINREGF